MKDKTTKYAVRALATYEGMVVIEANSQKEARETVKTMMENGEIDPVQFVGTLNCGGSDFSTQLIGKTDLPPTVENRHTKGLKKCTTK